MWFLLDTRIQTTNILHRVKRWVVNKIIWFSSGIFFTLLFGLSSWELSGNIENLFPGSKKSNILTLWMGELVFKCTLVTFLKLTVFEKLPKVEDEVRLINYTQTKIKIGQLQLRNRIIANRKSVLSSRKPFYNDPKTVFTALKLFLVDSKRNAYFTIANASLYDSKTGFWRSKNRFYDQKSPQIFFRSQNRLFL